MRAAVLNSIPGRLDIEDVEIDEPGPREVLVRTVGAGLCHSDLHFMEGMFRFPCPAVLGHESAGVVEAVGSMVSYVKPGDHVISCLSVFCGHCRQCTDGHLTLCANPATELSARRATASTEPGRRRGGQPVPASASFAELMLVHEHALVKIEQDMPLDRAALIGCGVITGLGAVFRTARVAPGATVAVIGCGGIGLAAIQGARIAGAGQIIAVDTNRRSWNSPSSSAPRTSSTRRRRPVAAVKELTGGGVDFVRGDRDEGDCRAVVQHAAQRGQATVIGMIPVGTRIEIHGPELLSEKKLPGSKMGSNQFRTDMPRFVDMYLDGRLHLDEMVSKTITLEQINDGFDDMKAGTVARSVILFD